MVRSNNVYPAYYGKHIERLKIIMKKQKLSSLLPIAVFLIFYLGLGIWSEYIMKIKVTAGVRDIYYYTRIINQANLNTENYLNFATGFYERCLNGNDEDRTR
jgi:hypothetical protein